jgi:hypothetical protein
MRRITDAVRADPVVEEVYRAKSEELGPGTYRFVAEIEFSGSKVVERYLDQGDGAKREQLHGTFIWLFGYLVIWLFGYLVISVWAIILTACFVYRCFQGGCG